MAIAPIVAPTLARKAVKRIYGRDAKGRFISKAKAVRRNRETTARQRNENFFREKWGAPPRGQTWHTLVTQYPDRFEDSIGELDAQEAR